MKHAGLLAMALLAAGVVNTLTVFAQVPARPSAPTVAPPASPPVASTEPPVDVETLSARAAMQRGMELYEKKAYGPAAEAFARAAEAAEKDASKKTDPAAAHFNEGLARFKAGEQASAAESFEKALASPDLALQSRAYYNAGNALMDQAEASEKQQQYEPALQAVRKAQSSYERAITLAPKEANPKVNYELAGLKAKELEKKIEEQKKQQQQEQQNKDQNKDPQQNEKKDPQKDGNEKSSQDQPQQQDENKDPANQDPKPAETPPSGKPESQDQAPQGEPGKFEEMTPEEARMMLDAMEKEEAAQREQMRLRLGESVPVLKNW